ncbi:MAG TPA: cyclomaltodextrinase C-terminal domain-containing protein, partial [Bacteroidales bacterium]|nr:cyclomaltodextrinase C-terminal domain-containing protein [Bacteroidales bacterium]
GEEWSDNQAVVAYWQKGQHNRDGYRPDLPSLMDFPMQSALVKAMNEKEEGGNTLINLFNALAMDYLYPDPFNLVIFADNHDMSRFFMQVNQDTSLFKLGMAYILTTRGIPQIFYGTEILMTHPGSNEHGDIRKDFPGGWPGDQVNGFTGEGLQPDQLSIQNYLRQLINWRKNEEVLHSGKILHYSPQNDAYVYFRYNDTKRIMVVLNKNNEPTELEMKRFSQGLHGLIKGKDVISGKSYDLTSPILLPARRPLILELE